MRRQKSTRLTEDSFVTRVPRSRSASWRSKTTHRTLTNTWCIRCAPKGSDREAVHLDKVVPDESSMRGDMPAELFAEFWKVLSPMVSGTTLEWVSPDRLKPSVVALQGRGYVINRESSEL